MGLVVLTPPPPALAEWFRPSPRGLHFPSGSAAGPRPFGGDICQPSVSKMAAWGRRRGGPGGTNSGGGGRER